MKYQVVLSTFIFTGLLSFFVGSPAWGGACREYVGDCRTGLGISAFPESVILSRNP
jgi:hypothetical protein